MNKKTQKIAIVVSILLVMVSLLYVVAVCSSVPFIKKWRTIYIETAMSTMSHQWLATAFIPESVVNKAMADRDAAWAAQSSLESNWNTDCPSGKDPNAVVCASKISGEDDFFDVFNEIDKISFREYVAEHPGVMIGGFPKLLIDESGLDKSGTSIFTTAGDQVLTIDVENGILILKVTGEGYCGKLAIVKDASRVKVAAASTLGSMGETVKAIADKNNAILGINASGFADYNGVGNGGEVVGLLVSDGKVISETADNGYMNIGFGLDDRLYIGYIEDISIYRDAVQFFPAEIINGKNVTDGSTGFGIQPRTSVGQAEDGDVLFLTVDGRQIGYSIGCTIGDCASIMQRYGAVQASNVDGGASTVMVYRGNEITKPANGCKFGRYVPDALVVEYK